VPSCTLTLEKAKIIEKYLSSQALALKDLDRKPLPNPVFLHLSLKLIKELFFDKK
jgi:hypothetical protein